MFDLLLLFLGTFTCMKECEVAQKVTRSNVKVAWNVARNHIKVAKNNVKDD